MKIQSPLSTNQSNSKNGSQLEQALGQNKKVLMRITKVSKANPPTLLSLVVMPLLSKRQEVG